MTNITYNAPTDTYTRLDDGAPANCREIGGYLADRIAMYVAHNLPWNFSMFTRGDEPAILYWTRKELPKAVKNCPW